MPETKRYSDEFIDDGVDCPKCHVFVNPFVMQHVPPFVMMGSEKAQIPARVVLECPREECKQNWYVTDESWTEDPDAAHAN
jgi:hypothetical protein